MEKIYLGKMLRYAKDAKNVELTTTLYFCTPDAENFKSIAFASQLPEKFMKNIKHNLDRYHDHIIEDVTPKIFYKDMGLYDVIHSIEAFSPKEKTRFVRELSSHLR